MEPPCAFAYNETFSRALQNHPLLISDGDIFPIGCFASRWGLIPELRGVGKRAIDVSNTDPAIIKCASLARNNDYSYFALGLNGRCLSSADAGTKYFKRGSTAAKKCRRGIGLTGASFVYTFGKSGCLNFHILSFSA